MLPSHSYQYIVYTDKYTGENVAIATSHLYIRDEKRFKQLRQSAGIVVDLPGFKTPSFIKNKSYVFNVKDQPIDFAHRDVHIKSQLPKSKAKKIFAFINKNRKNKSNKKSCR